MKDKTQKKLIWLLLDTMMGEVELKNVNFDPLDGYTILVAKRNPELFFCSWDSEIRYRLSSALMMTIKRYVPIDHDSIVIYSESWCSNKLVGLSSQLKFK